MIAQALAINFPDGFQLQTVIIQDVVSPVWERMMDGGAIAIASFPPSIRETSPLYLVQWCRTADIVEVTKDN